MKDKIICFLWQKLSPYYVERFVKEISKLPHEKNCASSRGPYQCNCAKQRIRDDLLFIIGDNRGVIESPKLKDVVK